MALNIETTVINPPAATGSQSYHPFSFQPKVLLFFGNRATASGSYQANVLIGMGVDDGTAAGAQRSQAFSVVDGGTTSATNNISNALAIVFSSSCEASVSAFLSDGFTLNWTATPGATGENIVVVGIGGTDVSNSFLKGTITAPNSTGNVAYTGVGFHPDLLIFLNFGAGSRIGWGVANATNEWSQCWGGGESGGVSLASTRQDTSHCFTMFQNNMANSKAIGCQASLVSLDSDGFTLNWNSATDTAGLFPTCFVLCLKGTYLQKVGSFSKSTAAAPVVDSLSFLFQPSFMHTATAGEATTSAAISGVIESMGVVVSGNQYALFNKANRSQPYVAKKYYDNTKGILTGTTSAIAAAGSVALTSSGADVTWNPNDGTASEVLYIALGAATSAVSNAQPICMVIT